jgi:hypothetical protein
VSTDRMEPAARTARRFARLPHDSQVEAAAKAWCIDCTPYKALELLLPELLRGAFLAHGKYNKRYCATLTRDGEHPDTLCNAVSGWGHSPAGAILDLAFRWIVLCQESWVIASHVPLVSEVGRDV